MTVRKAKKILKSFKDDIWPEKFYFKKVKYNKNRKIFICDNIWGQRFLTKF